MIGHEGFNSSAAAAAVVVTEADVRTINSSVHLSRTQNQFSYYVNYYFNFE